MRRSWCAVGFVFAVACSSSTDPDRGSVEAQEAVQEELAFVPHDYRLLNLRSLPFFGAPIAFLPMGLCAPDSTGVSDQNSAGVPRDLTLTWPAGRCVTPVQGFNDQFVGSIRIEDPGGGLLARLTYTGLRHTFNTSTSETDHTFDGTVELRATSGTSVTVEQHSTEHEVRDALNDVETKRKRDISVVITDTTGRLPTTGLLDATSITVSGAVGLVFAAPLTDSVRAEVSTPTPLAIDRLCVSGFRSGQLRAVASGTVNVTFLLNYTCQ